MNRRKFLKQFGAIPALSAFSPLLGKLAVKVPASFRRVRPTDPGWPSSAMWDKLKQQVGGRLIPVTSPLAPCTTGQDSAACAARLEEMKNPYFIADQPGGTQLSGW